MTDTRDRMREQTQRGGAWNLETLMSVDTSLISTTYEIQVAD
jgi:hypothetical protein